MNRGWYGARLARPLRVPTYTRALVRVHASAQAQVRLRAPTSETRVRRRGRTVPCGVASCAPGPGPGPRRGRVRNPVKKSTKSGPKVVKIVVGIVVKQLPPKYWRK